ncbi:hypothetical protein RRG08_006435 [Elysia crispata]|uniref:Uncharacterized protein n=1 Tax=Elysia crispata TaxID=231223 RepID=A0AAE0YIM4_9GAST|nr:hypothetical protein RRG08_006435 [Elysia crispata]
MSKNKGGAKHLLDFKGLLCVFFKRLCSKEEEFDSFSKGATSGLPLRPSPNGCPPKAENGCSPKGVLPRFAIHYNSGSRPTIYELGRFGSCAKVALPPTWSGASANSFIGSLQVSGVSSAFQSGVLQSKHPTNNCEMSNQKMKIFPGRATLAFLADPPPSPSFHQRRNVSPLAKGSGVATIDSPKGIPRELTAPMKSSLAILLRGAKPFSRSPPNEMRGD